MRWAKVQKTDFSSQPVIPKSVDRRDASWKFVNKPALKTRERAAPAGNRSWDGTEAIPPNWRQRRFLIHLPALRLALFKLRENACRQCAVARTAKVGMRSPSGRICRLGQGRRRVLRTPAATKPKSRTDAESPSLPLERLASSSGSGNENPDDG